MINENHIAAALILGAIAQWILVRSGIIKVHQALPFVLVLLDIMACVPFFFIGIWRRGVYWVAAGVLTLVVTF
jgi:hypothetical protein